MYEHLKRLYNEDKITELHLTNAVNKLWIKEEEKKSILDSKIL